MKEKTIGKIQVCVGIIILLTTIVCSIFIINNYYLGPAKEGDEVLLSVFNVSTSSGTISHEVAKELLPPIMIRGMVLKTAIYNFIASAAIIAVLSIIIILQGLANMSRK